MCKVSSIKSLVGIQLQQYYQMLVVILGLLQTETWYVANPSLCPNQRKFHIVFHKKSLMQDFFRKTLVSASHSIGLKWFMKYHSTATIIIPAKIDWFPNQLKLNPSWRCQFFFNSENSYHIHRGWIWFSMGVIYLLCLVLISSSVFPPLNSFDTNKSAY